MTKAGRKRTPSPFSFAPHDTRRVTALSLVTDAEHYDKVVLDSICRAKVSVWIATANLKDVHVEAPLGTVARARGRYVSMTENFVSLVRAGVEVRISDPVLARSNEYRCAQIRRIRIERKSSAPVSPCRPM